VQAGSRRNRGGAEVDSTNELKALISRGGGQEKPLRSDKGPVKQKKRKGRKELEKEVRRKIELSGERGRPE